MNLLTKEKEEYIIKKVVIKSVSARAALRKLLNGDKYVSSCFSQKRT